MRRSTSFSFVVLVLMLSSSVVQADDIVINSAGGSQTMETVHISSPSGPPLAPCLPGETVCARRKVTFRITPCPPGVTCTGDTYEKSYEPGNSSAVVVVLSVGTTYTLSGTYRLDLASPSRVPCNVFDCYKEKELASETYTAQPPVYTADWEIVPVAANEDSVWVEARILNVDLQNSCATNASCFRHVMDARISPCPLDIRELGGDWCNSNYVDYSNTIRTLHVALEVGKTYTFTGGVSTYGFRPEMGGACVEPECSAGESAYRVYSAVALPTRQTTWGAVKALYRSP